MKTGLTRQPRKGDRLMYRGQCYGTVARLDGNLCWTAKSDGSLHDAPFIWRFHDGLNSMFTIQEPVTA